MHPEKQKQAAYWNLEKKGMKTMKKFFAMFMALAMIMGMPAAAFAEEVEGAPSTTVTKPTAGDTTEAQIQNVEAGVTIEAYRIVEPVYNDSGFVKYQAVDVRRAGTAEGGPLGIGNPLAPTYAEVMAIAKNGDLTKLTAVKSTAVTSEGTSPFSFQPNSPENNNGLGTYRVNLGPGYWLVLVKGGKEVYNPMLLGVYYSVSGNDNTMVQNPVDANSNWTLEANAVVAKSSEVTIEKNADKETQNLGSTVTYTVKTTVPYYSDEYDTTKLKFKITDTLTGLELVNNRTESDTEDKWDIKVYSGTVGDEEGNIKLENQQYQSGGTEVEKGDTTWSFEGTTTASQYKISFASQWIKDNGGKDVVIVYSAALTDAAKVNQDPHNNKVSLSYTNDPTDETDDGKGTTDDEENVYTFEIDGSAEGLTKDLIKKVAPGETEETKGELVALPGAEFTLYKTYSGTPKVLSDKYTNSTIPADQEYTAKSDSDGQLKITGLAAGTYYLKETKAPSDYTLNDNIYKIEITNVLITDKKLKSWDVVITEIINGVEGTPKTSSFSVTENDGNVSLGVSHKNEEGTGDVNGVISTEIQNTKISTLPSTGGMGTTIFTIGGCIIMIAAAGLFFASRRKTSAK